MLNEDEANVNDPDIPVEVNDLINVALVPNEPEIPAAVKPLPPPSSKFANLVLIDELGAVNEPEMSSAIWAELDSVLVGKFGVT